MRIGIDIDNTVSETITEVIKYALEYDKKYKDGKGIINTDTYNFSGMFDWREEDKNKFLNIYSKNREKIVMRAKPKENAVKIINKLKKENNEIYFITGRDSNHYWDPYLASKKWLDKNKIRYDKLIVSAKYKGLICKENNIDVLIDDSEEQCNDAKVYGIKTLLFDSFDNKNSNLERVNNWNEIYIKIG